MICAICDSPCTEFATALVLGRYPAVYYECRGCGFIQVKDPHWLSEAYQSPIAIQDVGLVARNLAFAQTTAAIINICFRDESRFLDFGAGTGLFVRLMRDQGFDFRYYDPYATNAFARGFEAALDHTERYGLITAFEVMEHLTNPSAVFKHLLAFTDSVLFSTELIPSSRPKPGDWWYYALETGQHVSFFSHKTLEYLCSRNSVAFHTCGPFHLATRRKIRPISFRMACRPRFIKLINHFTHRDPLTQRDYEAAVRGFTAVT